MLIVSTEQIITYYRNNLISHKYYSDIRDVPAFSQVLLRRRGFHLRTIIVIAAVHRGFSCPPAALENPRNRVLEGRG